MTHGVNYDDSGMIGKKYVRNDEIGTPYCVTIDYETIENVANTVGGVGKGYLY